ncbi:MAG: DUF1552 domain-containing protein [Planctomycetota bacterium]
MTTSPLRAPLPRRTFLRGVGCALALPWLEAMPTPPRRDGSPRRAVFVFAPNGRNLAAWHPAGDGEESRFGPTLEALEPLRKELTVFRGLAIDAGRAYADSVGDHARAAATFLTCTRAHKTGGSDIRVGTSIDQLIARADPTATAMPSLELGMEPGAAAGVCDSGYSCAYSNNVSWRTPTTPAAKETDPRAAFTRLFGDPRERIDAAENRRRQERRRSVLDLALADAHDLDRRLGARDRGKLAEYLDAVRDLERSLEHLQAQSDALANDGIDPAFLDDHSADAYVVRLRAMYEIIALALCTDRTRVVSFMLGNAGSDRSYRFLDVPDGHHFLSHHGQDPRKLADVARIDRFHVAEFARFLLRLRSTGEGEGDLLAHSAVLFGSGIGDGNAHNHDDLPVLLAGRAGGRIRPRTHLRFMRETPMADLHLTIHNALGFPLQSFADSTGTIGAIT